MAVTILPHEYYVNDAAGIYFMLFDV